MQLLLGFLDNWSTIIPVHADSQRRFVGAREKKRVDESNFISKPNFQLHVHFL